MYQLKKKIIHFLGIFLALGHEGAIWGEVWGACGRAGGGALRLDHVM